MADPAATCPQCGTGLLPGAHFCGECGSSVDAPGEAAEAKLHTIAGLDPEAVKAAVAAAKAIVAGESSSRAAPPAATEVAAQPTAAAKPHAATLFGVTPAQAEREPAAADGGGALEPDADSDAHAEPEAAATSDDESGRPARSEDGSNGALHAAEPDGEDRAGSAASAPEPEASAPEPEGERPRASPPTISGGAPDASAGSQSAAARAPQPLAAMPIAVRRPPLAQTMLGMSNPLAGGAAPASSKTRRDSLPRGITPDAGTPAVQPSPSAAAAEQSVTAALLASASQSGAQHSPNAKHTLLGIALNPNTPLQPSAAAPAPAPNGPGSLGQTRIEGGALAGATMLGMPRVTSDAARELGMTRREGSGTALGLGAPASHPPGLKAAGHGRTMLGVPLASLSPPADGEAAVPAAEAHRAGASLPPSAAGQTQALHTLDNRRPLLIGIAVLVLVALAGLLFLRLSGRGKTADVSARIVSNEAGESLQFEVPHAVAGSKLRFGGQEQVLNAGHATFALAADSLRVGDNVVLADVITPSGETSSARIVLAVFYRIWVDTAPLRGEHPSMDVVVTAVPGTKVTLEGEAVSLDAQGRATRSYPIDVVHSGKSVVDHVVHYRMQPPKGETVVDELHTRIPVAMMQIDRPGPDVVTDRETVEIAGAVARDTQVTIDGASVPVKDGRFLHRLSLPKPGDYQPRVIATAAGKAPLGITLSIRRVRDLAQAAKEFPYDKSLNYAKIAANPANYKGQSIAIEGRVYAADARAGASVIQMLARPCPSSQRCSLWVVDPQAGEVSVDRWIRVLGVIDGEQQFRSEKNEIVTVPKITARYILPAKP